MRNFGELVMMNRNLCKFQFGFDELEQRFRWIGISVKLVLDHFSHLHCHPDLASHQPGQMFPVHLRHRRSRRRASQRRRRRRRRRRWSSLCRSKRFVSGSSKWSSFSEGWDCRPPPSSSWGPSPIGWGKRLRRHEAAFLELFLSPDEGNIFPQKVEDNQLVSWKEKG